MKYLYWKRKSESFGWMIYRRMKDGNLFEFWCASSWLCSSISAPQIDWKRITRARARKITGSKAFKKS